MADDNTIIEGTVKFRDGKKWKPRWCVMRKLSPVADCVHLQLYRDARVRWAAAGAGGRGGGGGGCKASLSLQQYLGSEAGFTLDKHSNTLALLCRDLTALLAFDTRERLIQWQVKVHAHLGSSRQFLVLVGSATSSRARLAAGPARLHVTGQRFALTAGVPPRLLGVWELQHLRRYGVVESRFCFEGGSHCGKGEGLHVLVTDQAHEITDTFDLAAQGKLTPKKRPLGSKKSEAGESPKSHKAYRPDTRLSELHERCLPPNDLPLYSETACDVTWPSAERAMGHGDATSACELAPSGVSLTRCRSCMSKLGALSRSSTAALTPGARHFSPNWTMDSVTETPTDENVLTGAFHTISRSISSEVCRCRDRPPDRPPKPTRHELSSGKKPPMPLPGQAFRTRVIPAEEVSRGGPYENYDVPKLPSAEDGEYYDTPKRLKECFNEDLFKITKSSTPDTLILKKPCGCLLKFGRRRREPTVIDTDENFQSTDCPCQRVTNWANNWIKTPYCKRDSSETDDFVPNKENLRPNASDQSALYATIDLSRKTRRKQSHSGDFSDLFTLDVSELLSSDSRAVEIDDGPLANYENLSFALSLEHYENAKDLLKKAGVTQTEIDAISANLNPVTFAVKGGKYICTKCGHTRNNGNKNSDLIENLLKGSGDDYLLMKPNNLENKTSDQNEKCLSSGYTPMSPVGGFAFHTLKNPAKSQISKLLDEKSASNPTLCGDSPNNVEKSVDSHVAVAEIHAQGKPESLRRREYRKRSSSADSSRFLDDVKEFEGGADSHGSASSIETLCNLEVETSASPCGCRHKSSDADSVTRAVRRSASVPGGAGCRDSSSSNDSGVSSCSLRAGAEFELPLTTSASRRLARAARGRGCLHASLPRRSRSTDPLTPHIVALQRVKVPVKSSSAEAEVPVISVKPLRSVADTHSTSSGTSDMSDYIETLSLCSSHSSTDTPITMRVVRQTTSTLRPRSGKEYLHLDPRVTRGYRLPAHDHRTHPHYTNLPP